MTTVLSGFLLLLALLCPLGAWAAVPQAFLVQNSGWMEPFYSDVNSPFKRVVEGFITAVADPTEIITISAFNQAIPGNDSPQVAFIGVPGREMAAALARLGVAQKSTGALADTDITEAVTKTVLGTLKSKPGIIWIFTNNKNSPGNDPQTAKRNREFYAVLHEEPSIVRTLAFPLAMPVAGKSYRANGLMVYAVAYGREAEARLINLVSGPARRVLTEPPARLKPLDQESVGLIPGEIRGSPGTKFSLGRDHQTIILDVDVSQRQPIVEFTARVENRFYPYVIEHAAVTAQFVGRGWADHLRVTPASLSALEPGDGKDVLIALPLPLAQIPSMWAPNALGSMGKQFSIPGGLEISLIDQRLEVAGAFRKRLADIFPGDPLSEIFTPSRTVRGSKVTIPVIIRVSYPIYPLVVIGASASVGAALVLGILVAIAGEKRFEIIVDGQARRIAVKAFRSTQILATSGEKIGTLKRGLGRPTVSDIAPRHSITVRA